MKSQILTLALLAGSALPAYAETHRYNHNGSAMLVEVNGNRVEITYDNPRPALHKHGVKRGTRLFNGTTSRLDNGGLYLEGKARIFRRGCKPTTYFVYGDFRAAASFKLSGAAPVLSKNGCRVVDNIHTGSNANLAFTAVSVSASNNQPQQAQHEKLGWSKLCVRGVITSLKLRTGPGTHYSPIGELPADACDVASLDQCINGWCAVLRGESLGWVARQYLVKAR